MNPEDTRVSGQLKKVLVVDDDESTAAFVRAVLQPARYEVMAAGDGLAGLARARKEHPDLIILDVYMPRQVGFYTLSDLKKDPETRDIPVIMLTGVAKRMGFSYAPEDIYDFLGAEPDVYLEKPVDPDFLVETADKLLGMGPAADGLPTKEK